MEETRTIAEVVGPIKGGLEGSTKAIKKLWGEIEQLEEEGRKLKRKGFLKLWELGARLTLIKKKVGHGAFLPWLKENIAFSERSARNYMRLFEYFKSATVADLEGLTIKQAMIQAGVMKCLPGPEGEGENLDEEPEERPDHTKHVFDEKFIRKCPVYSGRPLKYYRVRPRVDDDGKIDVVRQYSRGPYPALWITAHRPEGLPDLVWEHLRGDLISALENYCGELELLERDGVVRAPVLPEYQHLIKAQKNIGRKRVRGKLAPGKAKDFVDVEAQPSLAADGALIRTEKAS